MSNESRVPISFLVEVVMRDGGKVSFKQQSSDPYMIIQAIFSGEDYISVDHETNVCLGFKTDLILSARATPI